MSLPNVIGICGKMGAGKDEVGYILETNHGYMKTSFAQELRKEVHAALCIAYNYKVTDNPELHFPVQPLEQYDSTYAALRAFQNLVFAAEGTKIGENLEFGVWAKPTSPDIRILLQWWGTEYRRVEDEDYWVKKWLNKWITVLLDGTKLCITDVRYNNEAAMCKLMGVIWEVYGRNCENEGIKEHASEKGVSLVFEMYVPNHGTVKELTKTINWLIGEHK